MGDAFSIDIIGYGPLVVFSDEESVKRITAARPEEFTHANDIVAFFVGQNSIFLLDGDAHKHARRRTLSAFAGDRMKRYGEVMKRAADRYIDGLRPNQTISAMDAGTTMALEIILIALFGMEPGARVRPAGRRHPGLHGRGPQPRGQPAVLLAAGLHHARA
jgi:cytochrome P450